MDEFLTLLQTALTNHTCIRMVLSKPTTVSDETPRKITIRPVQIKGRMLYQWTHSFTRKETHLNLDSDQTIAGIRQQLGPDFHNLNLTTTDGDTEIRQLTPGKWKFKHKPSQPREMAIIEHNIPKNYLIPEGVPCPFLQEIGVMNAQGKVLQAKYPKFRQINRYLEFVNDILPHLPTTGKIRIVDDGCGKSYLTFALHDLLTRIHKREVEMIGLDLRPDVIAECKRVVQKLKLTGLEFHNSSIATFDLAGEVDLAVSLHACDTATDDAIMQAVKWNAKVIMAVPCCQHEFFQKGAKVDGFQQFHRHGILQERFCALATDAYRAMALEVMGYDTQVMEFIDMEHTPKNLLIRSIKRKSNWSPHCNMCDLDHFIGRLGLDLNALGLFALEHNRARQQAD